MWMDALWFCGVVVVPYFFALFVLKLVTQKWRKDNGYPAPPKPVTAKSEPIVGSNSPSFVARSSHFDGAFRSDGSIMTSNYHGLFNLCAIAASFFLMSHHLRHLIKEGTIWGFRSFIAMFERPDVLGVWVGMIVIAFLAYPIQLLFVRYDPPVMVQRLVHVLVVGSMFFWVISMVWLHPGWPLIPTGSLCCSMMVVMLKTHSYIANNYNLARARARRTRRELRKGENSSSSPVSSPSPSPATSPLLPKQQQKKEAEKEVKEKKGQENASALSPAVQKFSLPGPDYPKNVTFWNWFDFMLVPTLVYDTKYPRTSKIRIGYLIEKLALILGVVTFLHLVSQYYIVPALIRSPDESAIEVVAELIVPFFFCIMLIFYLIFDCICNGFAELTCFADREFYKDWWNSTTMDEFARTWNIPVHKWLLHHVYLESLQSYKISKHTASFITFLFSSLLHELVMVLCFRMFTPFLFFSQLLQIPLIMLGKDLKGTRIGNCFFWIGLLLGVPLLSLLYCREYYTNLRNAGVKPEPV